MPRSGRGVLILKTNSQCRDAAKRLRGSIPEFEPSKWRCREAAEGFYSLLREMPRSGRGVLILKTNSQCRDAAKRLRG